MRGRTMSRYFLGASLCSLLFIWTLFSPGLAGQEKGRGAINGRVRLAESGDPAPRARVFLENGMESNADSDGLFSFDGLQPGSYRIAAVGKGCFVALGDVQVEGEGSTFVDFSLIAPHLAPASTISLKWEELSGVTGSPWKVIGAEEIATMGATDLLQVLQSKVPQMVGTGGGASGRGRIRSIRGNNSALGPNLPVVIVDGIRIQAQIESALLDIDPGQVARIEVFRGPAGAWVHGSGSTGGVIRVFSKRFQLSIDPETPPNRCGNPLAAGGG